ncbi:transposase domain-containing protein [Streptomyces tuirus]|uniref:transposase domain-containing protein n=1 Tax=Streptomyces tuirus TaxID=68278 RepID=UPI003F4DCF7E
MRIGILTKVFTAEQVDAAIAKHDRAERRRRLLPARPAVYFVLVLCLFAREYPADELVALYRERWEIELAFDEIKNHLGPGGPIRSRTPEGVRQELWGLPTRGQEAEPLARAEDSRQTRHCATRSLGAQPDLETEEQPPGREAGAQGGASPDLALDVRPLGAAVQRLTPSL